MPMTILGI